jgi:signal transduction histidine kinase/ActR/RegA family two-component response regulator
MNNDGRGSAPGAEWGPQGEIPLQTVLDSLTHPLYVIDVADYRVRMTNRAAREAQRTGASTCYALTHHQDAPCHTEGHPCPIEIIKDTGRPTVVEHVHYDAAGAARNVEVHAFPIFDETHRLIRIIEYCVDVTERKRTEEALRELTATLETKVAERTAELEHRANQLQKLTLALSEAEDRERKRLAEILHDDLQQMLAGAKFHLSLLKRRAQHDPLLEAMASEIDGMLKDAIDKSRSLSHELSPAVLHHSDFAEILRWLAGQMHDKHGMFVHVHAGGEVDTQSDAIKAFLYKAAQETLFNVFKHAGVNEARVRVRRLNRYLCLSVSDHGRGFDPTQLERSVGFGLLSIRERVEMLGGRMKIRSAPGKGSTFLIALPDGEGPEAATQVAAKADSNRRPSFGSRGGASLRVVVADDHVIVRAGLLSLLNDEPNIEVVGEAASGQEAVDLAGRLEPDVVIMDVSMSPMNWDKACQRIKQARPKTRIIALSMHDEADVMEKMYAAGAEAYVLKTAPSEELLAAIRGEAQDKTSTLGSSN